jgi:hypothetical protein
MFSLGQEGRQVIAHSEPSPGGAKRRVGNLRLIYSPGRGGTYRVTMHISSIPKGVAPFGAVLFFGITHPSLCPVGAVLRVGYYLPALRALEQL